jgi:HK97 family phage major capsid protein
MQTEIIEEFRKGLTEIKDGVSNTDKNMNSVSAGLRKLEQENERLEAELTKVRRLCLARASAGVTTPSKGMVSDEFAAHLGATFIFQCAKSGKLELLSQSSATRDALINSARQTLGIEIKSALTTTDIPLPVGYSGELRALIAQFGVVRKAMFPYPIGMGTAKPPRMGARPQFASVAMSGTIAEGSPGISFASLESHKIGGLVRVPREIEEQSIVPMGQFLARYGAVEFARAEDKWGFLADGSATYEQVKGVVQVATDNSKTKVLDATKVAPSDAVINDFRLMRLNVATPVLSTGCYFMNATWEQRLRQFKTQADPRIYDQHGPNGRPTLDGYDVIWTEVLQPYGTTAVPATTLAVFGDLSFWWMGEHLSPRIDTSDQVFFVNDQLAVRFIEEIDFDYMDVAAAAALQTAAS